MMSRLEGRGRCACRMRRAGADGHASCAWPLPQTAAHARVPGRAIESIAFNETTRAIRFRLLACQLSGRELVD